MPEPTDVTFFATAVDFRRWLEEHHATARELWVGYRKKTSGEPSVGYQESVDEALAFGWIDGVRKGLGPTAYTNRFTPRKPGSTWSAANVRRVGELTAEGHMHPAGLAAFAARDPAKTELYSYERETAALDADAEARFRGDEKAWAFWEKQPPGYRRTITWWVVSAKQEATRRRRLEKLIAESAAGRRLL